MHSADGLHCHLLQGLFHWQRAAPTRSHPVLVWSTSNDWFIGGREAQLFPSNMWQPTSHFSSELPAGSAEAIVGVHYDSTSPSVPSCILSLPLLGVHPKGIKLCMPTSGAVWLRGIQSVMHGCRSFHEPFVRRGILLYDHNTFGFEEYFKLIFIIMNPMWKVDIVEREIFQWRFLSLGSPSKAEPEMGITYE